MSVTVERIATPRGAQVEGVGISPDVPVTLTEADMERGVDTQLQAALQAAAMPSMLRPYPGWSESRPGGPAL
jgi:C-terminal processing protease CtpA/Prc